MTYQVTARKWRPQVADDVVGQSHVTTTLRNAIATNRLSHAYIFSGPRGVGKTTTARILARAINCIHPKDSNPDNICDICREITEGRSVNVFEIDGASNRGVDEIRNLRESVRYAPARGKYKVYIIDEVHMLTKEAFNALLKTLEEPPPYILFIFATTEIHKVPATILSRCQRFDFRRISIHEIMGRLRHIASEEKITIEDNALLIIAKRADGSMRDAQSVFDQVVSFCGTAITAEQIIQMLNVVDEEIFFRTTDIVTSKDSKAALLLVDDIVTRGVDVREFLQGLIEHFRNLLIAVTTGSNDLIETSEPYKQRYQEQAMHYSENDLLRLIKLTSDIESTLRWSQQPRYKLEIGLMNMIKLDSSVQIMHLLDQLDELKKKIDGGKVNSFQKSITATSPELQNSMPVKGAVKASQPVLRPDQIVLPSISTTSEPIRFSVGERSSSVSGSAAPIAQDPPAAIISKNEAQQKWTQFVAEVSKQRVHVGAILGATAILDVRDNSLQIACPDGFHLDTLKRNKQFLVNLAESIYGAKMKLETMVANIQQSPSTFTAHDRDSALPVASSESPENRRHPIIRALIREFGAKELDS
ncbi:MAG: DNA polymerase III subunit gamma/tau [Ignavibacteriae bacterium]|nr:DNA polymerase III subunit gamma/tau [Ignavibacteria bacterium]MBI3365345.1 DNA polymerase III subunit gamma/tau [Ignavibacteriota bacterium]